MLLYKNFKETWIVLAWVRITLQRMIEETVRVVEFDREVSTTGYCIEGHYMFHTQPTEQMFPSNDKAQVFLDVVASRFLIKKTQTKTKPTKPHKRPPKQTNQPPPSPVTELVKGNTALKWGGLGSFFLYVIEMSDKELFQLKLMAS